MYNLVLAIGAGSVGYAIGAAVAGWIAGFVPALLALGVAYVLLARRTGRRVEAVFAGAMVHMQAGKLDAARIAMESALPLGKWQFLVAPQIHSQIGSLDYLEGVGMMVQRQPKAAAAKFASARAHLEQAWSRDWRGRTLLACVHHREGRVDDALKALERASGAGKGETLFWGVYVYVLNEAKKRDEALQVVGRGLKESPDSKVLKELQEAMSNKRRPDMKAFGDSWYQFFPDQVPQEVLMKQQQQMAANRKGLSPKTWPQPRR